MSTADFLEAVRQIAQSRPAYREGGLGRDGTCDCIGLIMGAMYACGHADYDLHSTNYFVRCQTEELAVLHDQSQLQPGMMVYKARTSMDTLNVRYQPGGRYHNGDLLDYYHVGVVESVQPLSIVHCTSTALVSGIAYDDSIAGWTHCGSVKGVSGETQAAYTAIVTAASGSTVNLRIRPDRSSPVAARISVGTAVAVSESAEGWARVAANGLSGYMMEAFLKQCHPQEDCVRIPRSAVLSMIETLRACALADTEEESL